MNDHNDNDLDSHAYAPEDEILQLAHNGVESFRKYEMFGEPAYGETKGVTLCGPVAVFEHEDLVPDELAWSDAGFGPNSLNVQGAMRTPSATNFHKQFVIDPKVAHKFNAYAAEAFPAEIGGLLRVVETDDEIRAIDVKVFPHVASSGGYFELDGQELAKWTMGMYKDGLSDEIPQWRSIIHSHPSMPPFLSGPDEKNLFLLAGENYAYSVICSASRNPNSNYFAMHYGQTSPTKMLVEGVAVVTDEGFICGGTNSLSDEEIVEIRAHAREMLSTVEPLATRDPYIYFAERSRKATPSLVWNHETSKFNEDPQ